MQGHLLLEIVGDDDKTVPTQGQRKTLLSTLGIVNSLNADFGGRRG